MIKSEYLRGEIPSSKAAYGTLLALAVPSVVEMVLTSLISSIDTMMVGGIGTAALASVGLTVQPRLLALSLAIGTSYGVTAVIARRKGEERPETASATLRLVLILIFFLSAVIAVLVIVFAPQIMLFAGANEDTLAYSVTYYRIFMSALPINSLMLCINAAQRGIGRTRITMYVNIVANVVNVIFNYLLIGGNFGFPKLGVAGAALASVIGICCGFALTLTVIVRKGSYFNMRYTKRDFTFEKDILLPVATVSSGALLEQICMRIGFLLFARFVALLGTEQYAAHQICVQFLQLTYNFAEGIGVAGTSLVGQNLGRRRPDISMMYGKMSQRVALIAAILLAAMALILKYPAARLFSNDTVVIEYAAHIMIFVAIFQPFQMSAVVLSGCLRGAGDTKFVARTMFICITFIRPTAGYLAIHALSGGLTGAWLAMLLDICIRFFFVYRRFSQNKWAAIVV